MATKKRASPQDQANARVEAAVKRKRSNRPFPACDFEEALGFAKEIFEYGSGQPVKRLSLFDHLKKSPESSSSRMAIVNANKYGLLKGSYISETLDLSPEARRVLDEAIPPRDQVRAKVQLAVSQIEPFRLLYEKFAGNKLPARAALIDAIRDIGIAADLAEEAVDTFVVNVRFVGLLQTLSGADRLVTLEHLIDDVPQAKANLPTVVASASTRPNHALVTAEHATFEATCFYITPIGEDGSPERKHSDLFLGSLIEPALENVGLKVIRADAIDKPGTITRQVIEYLMRARLVIADLSFHNPNVFYELAIRHAARLPVVQIIRAADRIPFDLNQVRTIKIDTSDIYTLVPRLDSYRAEISSQVRRALEDPESVDNPISTYFPDFAIQAPPL